jgi:hypothetical protein
MRPPPRPVRRLVWALSALLCAACGDDEAPVVEGVIDRDTFIEAYVDLRVATVEGSDLTLLDTARDSILATHGVDAESLLDFVEAYGRELDYMNELWSEVERRMEARGPEQADDAVPGRTS